LEETQIPPKKRALDHVSFEALLAALDGNRDRAGIEYERLRRRLIQYFTLRRAARPEDLTDEALNRLARKVEAGESIRSVPEYLVGIARMLCHEDQKRLRQEGRAVTELARMSPQVSPDPDLLRVLEACLKALPAAARKLIERYYSAEGRARIETRKRMAEELGVSLNTLRNRALRAREDVEACARKHLGAPGVTDIRPLGGSTSEGRNR
jgi:DNA-directed RNA polymerase specialized sigma24 family protein